MDDINYVALSDIAEVNPPTDLHGLDDNTTVSFIPMADVSESGEWINQQARPLKDVRNGYTCFQEYDILFAKITPCMENGKGAHATKLVKHIGFGTTEFHILRAKSRVHPRFIYHWIMNVTLRRKAEARMTGSAGQRRVPASFFGEFKVPFFPLPEQHRIAKILDTINEAIQKTEALISKLKAMKQGLLHDLLTRGLDKNGKLRDPKTHPEQFTDSQIGYIPITWSVEKLGSLAFVTKLAGFEYTKYFDYSITGEIIAVRVLNIRNGELDLSDIHTIPRATSKLLPRSALEKGDLVLSYVGTIGEAAIVREDDRFHLAPNVAKITPNKEFFLPDFLLYQILSQSGQKRLFDLATLTSQPAISMARIRMFLTLVPSLLEQESICEIIGAHDARIRAEEQYRDKLKLQKKGLMHDLLTGKIRVEV